MAKWLGKHWQSVILYAGLGSLLAWILYDRTVSEIWNTFWSVFLVVFGLGFVIFIHELGHFLAAKACGVRVETFSIGFGRAIPGCHFKWGETEYKLAVFPLGGYVKMLGQIDPGEKEEDEQAANEDPRSYKNKTVPQRMLIISAGVIMNIILGLGCFIYAYLAGKNEVAPRFGSVEPGSPADLAGIEAGSEILQIDDNTKPTYEDLFFVGAFATPGETEIFLKWRTPGGEVREAKVIPRRRPDIDPKPAIGVRQPAGLNLFRGMREGKPPALEGSPAEQVGYRRGFHAGDRVVGIKPVSHEGDYYKLNIGPDLTRYEYEFRDQPLMYQVLGKGWSGGELELFDIGPVKAEQFRTLGVCMEIGAIASVGADAPSSVREKLQPGDTIVGVKRFDAKGLLRSVFETLRPFYRFARTPGLEHANDWAVLRDSMQLPDLVAEESKGGKPVKLLVRRKSDQGLHWTSHAETPFSVFASTAGVCLDGIGPFAGLPGRLAPQLYARATVDEITVTPHQGRGTWNEELPSPASPIGIPSLGVSYEVKLRIVFVEPGSPGAKAGLRAGDVVKSVKFQETDGAWSRPLKLEEGKQNWASAFISMQTGRTVQVVVDRPGQGEVDIGTVTAGLPRHKWWFPDRGLYRETDRQTVYADDVGEAITMGFRYTHRTIGRIYLHLNGLINRNLSVKENLGGPIQIVKFTYLIAESSFNDLILFLGMISINLAVINFLPIPILDGGHFVFLAYEGIRGKPASENAMAIANTVGLVLLASLMLFVIFLDISKLDFVRKMW